jgi:hypothetical protein
MQPSKPHETRVRSLAPSEDQSLIEQLCPLIPADIMDVGRAAYGQATRHHPMAADCSTATNLEALARERHAGSAARD